MKIDDLLRELDMELNEILQNKLPFYDDCAAIKEQIRQKLEPYSEKGDFKGSINYDINCAPYKSVLFTGGDPRKFFNAINSDISNILKEDSEKISKSANKMLDNKKKIGLCVFLSFIVCLAVGAIVCMVAEFLLAEESVIKTILGKIGNAFGLLDFTLGAVAFVWERISDIKNEDKKLDLHTKMEEVQKAPPEKLNETTLEYAKSYVNILQKGFINHLVINLQ